MEVTAPTERTKLNEEESSSLTALTVDGDSCSEQDFDDRGCSKTNELFFVVIDGWGKLIAWTTFSCSLTVHAHFQV